MLLFTSNSNNPYFNLAYEQYLAQFVFQIKEEPILFLWRNDATIVVGQNQVAQFEVDIEKAHQDNIRIVKRKSGGGAVFHDLGNFCFSFIVADQKQAGNYKIFVDPIVKFLKKYNVNAELIGKNDLKINDYKISGNAQYLINNVLVHHGTLLYNANLASIGKYLKPNLLKIKTKAQRSVVSQVKNIAEFIHPSIDQNDMFNKLIEHFKNQAHVQSCNLNDQQQLEVEKIQKIYESQEWNFNHPFGLDKICEKRFEFGTITLWMKLENNLIKKILFEGDFLSTCEHDDLSKLFINQICNQENIEAILGSIDLEKYFGKITSGEILSLFSLMFKKD